MSRAKELSTDLMPDPMPDEPVKIWSVQFQCYAPVTDEFVKEVLSNNIEACVACVVSHCAGTLKLLLPNFNFGYCDDTGKTIKATKIDWKPIHKLQEIKNNG